MIRVHGKTVPTELAELVEPSYTALLVIDMQNDFCAPGGASDRGGASLSMYPEVIGRIADVLRAARGRGVPVLFARMVALPDGQSDSPAWIRLRLRASQPRSAEGAAWTFTIDGSWGAEFVAALRPAPGEQVITKYRSSALHGTDLDTMLRSNGVRTLVVTGCTTEGCVESTIRDAGMHDYFTVLLSDCVGSDDPALHEASMRVMTAYRTDVATSAELIAAWSAAAAAGRDAVPAASSARRGEDH
jgi:nicotinamidase-related amidase